MDHFDKFSSSGVSYNQPKKTANFMNRRMYQQTTNRNLDAQMNESPNNIYLSSVDMKPGP